MKTTLKSIVLTLLLFSNSLIFAEDPNNPLDPGVDPGVTPINDYIVPMLLFGIALSFFLLKKRKTA
ncbi:MAG: hypothetical protein QE264_04315 [Flavobacterium sp.]|jgi:hypothetical protein|nr:hypothetical protein [Flavobacterium sp.]